MRWLAAFLGVIIVGGLGWGGWVLLTGPACTSDDCGNGKDIAVRVPFPGDPARWTLSADPPITLPKGGPTAPDLVKRFARDDIWAFSTDGGALEVTRWDGKRWLTITPEVPESFHLEDVTGTGPDDIWISGTGMALATPGDRSGPGGVLAHWDGHGWRRLPVAAAVIALASVAKDDVWALFDGKIMHWDGRTWTPSPMPGIPMPASVDGDKPGSLLREIIALGANDVWALGAVTTNPCCDRWVHHREVVMRWDGRAWKPLDLGIRGLGLLQAAPDGAGGLWIATKREDSTQTPIAIHYRDGHWSQSTLPRPGRFRSAEAEKITSTATGEVVLTATGYPAGDELPTTLRYRLAS